MLLTQSLRLTLQLFVAMVHSQGTADAASPCASMQSLDDMLRKILMLLPQDDRCHCTQKAIESNQRPGDAMT